MLLLPVDAQLGIHRLTTGSYKLTSLMLKSTLNDYPHASAYLNIKYVQYLRLKSKDCKQVPQYKMWALSSIAVIARMDDKDIPSTGLCKY